MNNPQRFLCALSLLLAAAASHAGAPAGAVTQLSGWVMAVKPDGRARALSAQSKLEVGETLVSEQDSYVRLALADGNEVVMGPATTLKIERLATDGTALALVNGQLQVTGVPGAQDGRFTIAAGANSIDAGAASFLLAYVPPSPGSAVAKRLAYQRTSLAALGTGATTDAGSDLPLRDATRELVAQAVLPQSTAARAPGLYVQIIDGLIHVTNPTGVSNFSAGQFGYTASPSQPPVVVPKNPGIQFTLPPAFNQTSGPASSSTPAKSNTVDCEVR
jgi:hypothetical protein